MKKVRKSTMVEFVAELEQLLAKPGLGEREQQGLKYMIAEAKAGEYHDYKNNKYVCGKVASSGMLRAMGFIPLAKRIENGEFDEEADESDKTSLKQNALDGGFTKEQCKKLFNI